MPKPKRLTRLADRGRELVSFVLNTAAFGTRGDDSELETMAAKLRTTAGRLRPTLRKLAAREWLTIEGKSAQFFYPWRPSCQ